jgi:hypothetical protein
LNFDALQMRLHPAASRIAKLSVQTPARLGAVQRHRARRPGEHAVDNARNDYPAAHPIGPQPRHAIGRCSGQ